MTHLFSIFFLVLLLISLMSCTQSENGSNSFSNSKTINTNSNMQSPSNEVLVDATSPSSQFTTPECDAAMPHMAYQWNNTDWDDEYNPGFAIERFRNDYGDSMKIGKIVEYLVEEKGQDVKDAYRKCYSSSTPPHNSEFFLALVRASNRQCNLTDAQRDIWWQGENNPESLNLSRDNWRGRDHERHGIRNRVIAMYKLLEGQRHNKWGAQSNYRACFRDNPDGLFDLVFNPRPVPEPPDNRPVIAVVCQHINRGGTCGNLAGGTLFSEWAHNGISSIEVFSNEWVKLTGKVTVCEERRVQGAVENVCTKNNDGDLFIKGPKYIPDLGAIKSRNGDSWNDNSTSFHTIPPPNGEERKDQHNTIVE